MVFICHVLFVFGGLLVLHHCTRQTVKVKVKGKVVPVLLTEHHSMKAYWGVEV
jgi:hypothetical protein